jgi:uncharacterized protein CbrC (UPF0167 family)
MWDPREIEPLSNYNILATEDHSAFMLVIPGYFKGKALVGELHYGGGEHAVLVRNKHQIVLCDYINPHIREKLVQMEKVLISEPDKKSEYEARVVKENVDKVAAEVLRIHDYSFPYHPFPIADGTLTVAEAECEICGKKTDLYYSDTYEDPEAIFAEKTRKICPKCVVENQEDLFRNLGKEYRIFDGKNGVFRGNLPFYINGRDTSFWANHCDAPAVYLGNLEPEDLTPDVMEELEKNWNWLLNAYGETDPGATLGRFDRGELICHLFRCKECGELLCGFSEIHE